MTWLDLFATVSYTALALLGWCLYRTLTADRRLPKPPPAIYEDDAGDVALWDAAEGDAETEDWLRGMGVPDTRPKWPWISARSVPCPRCGAKPGEFCNRKWINASNTLMRYGFHKERRAAPWLKQESGE